MTDTLMAVDDRRHGTNAGHRAHITDKTPPCQPCKDAHATYRRNLWRRKYLMRVDTLIVPAIGAHRRIRALQAIGWRLADIDAALGYTKGSNGVHNITRQESIRRDTAERIEAVYERMCMTPGPHTRPRNLAVRRGWAPPLAWLNIDDPDETPTDWAYRPSDRADILADLDEHHAGISEVCQVLDVRRETLDKWCARHGHGELFSRLVRREQPDYDRLSTARRAS